MSADNNNSTATTTSNNINNMNSNRLKRILIVDDEPDIISVFKMVLEMNDFEVDAYNDPSLALSNFKQNAYGLVILDIRMPHINGFELYKKIRTIDDKVNVCFMTAFDINVKALQAVFPLSSDLDGCFIRKPVHIEDFIARIKSELDTT